MADINHLISLGIGSPSGIPEFITFGLQIGEVQITLEGSFRRMDATSERLSMDADSTKLIEIVT